MSTSRRRTGAVTLAGVVAGAAIALATGLLAGAGHHEDGPGATAPAQPIARHDAVPSAIRPVDDTPSSASEDPGADDPTAADGGLADDPVLSQIARADAPRGAGPQIALRFLLALQRHDDLAADRELYSLTRQWFSYGDLAELHRVLSDVRHNAGLEHATRCTRAVRLSAEAALVTCGRLHVVVHVLHDELASGVQIGDWSYHRDVYRGPHTHAITARQ